MQTVTVREKLRQMQQKYLDDADAKTCATLSEEDAEKILTIKKKLANLEKERCMKLRDGKDVTAIDQKIAKQKERFIVYCRKNDKR